MFGLWCCLKSGSGVGWGWICCLPVGGMGVSAGCGCVGLFQCRPQGLLALVPPVFRSRAMPVCSQCRGGTGWHAARVVSPRAPVVLCRVVLRVLGSCCVGRGNRGCCCCVEMFCVGLCGCSNVLCLRPFCSCVRHRWVECWWPVSSRYVYCVTGVCPGVLQCAVSALHCWPAGVRRPSW